MLALSCASAGDSDTLALPPDGPLPDAAPSDAPPPPDAAPPPDADLADSDFDGVPDIVEEAAGSDPLDGRSGLGDDLFFVLPLGAADQSADLRFTTEIRAADVVLSVDTTGSMGPSVAELQQTLAATIIPELLTRVDSVAIGVASFEDFPVLPFGAVASHEDGSDDRPFELHQRVTTDVAAAQRGVDALSLGNGGDARESGLEALYQIATGEGFAWSVPEAGSVGKFDARVGFDPALGHGLVGGAGFRVGALPIIVHVTDVQWHGADDYLAAGLVETHSRAQVSDALRALGARVVGVTSDAGARADLARLARETGTVVPPSAWGAQETDCRTGEGGVGQTVDATGLCPLAFAMNSDGTGVSSALVDGIAALVGFGEVDVFGAAVADPDLRPIIDTSRFVVSIRPVDPPPGVTVDGASFRGVRPGTQLTFRLRARNSIVAGDAEDRVYRLTIRIFAAAAATDERTVYVVVPAGDIVQ